MNRLIVLIMAAAVAVVALTGTPALPANSQTDQYDLPWVLDTTGALTTSSVRVVTIAWFGCSSDGHDFILKDTDGDIVWQDLDGEDGKVHWWRDLNIEADGLDLDTLDSGTLLMQVKEKKY
jgi:hypothetical protein